MEDVSPSPKPKAKNMCPLRFLVLFVLVHVRGESDLSIEPKQPKPVYEYETASVRISANESYFVDRSTVQVKIKLREDWLVERAVLLNTTLNLTESEPFKNFTVQGVFVGYAWADLQVCNQDKCEEEEEEEEGVEAKGDAQGLYRKLNETVRFIVVRRRRHVDTLFTVVIIALVVTANLGMGCTVDIQVVKAVLKRPIAPVIGFVCQFGIMPPLSFALGRLFNLSVAEQLGLLAVGCSPGGGASNMWTVLFNGDVNLSITMTLLSTIASFGMFPLWMFTLGKIVMDEAQFAIPFRNILTSLLGLIIPIMIGILIQRKRPEWAKKIGRITKPMLFLFLVVIFTFGVWVNWYMFKLFHLRMIAASILLPWVGFVGGAVVAFAARQEKSSIIAICIETGVQNAGVAIFALRLSLPQPLNDLSIASSVCPSIFMAAPLIVGLVAYTVYQRFRNPKKNGIKEAEIRQEICQENSPELQTMTSSDYIENGDCTRQEGLA